MPIFPTESHVNITSHFSVFKINSLVLTFAYCLVHNFSNLIDVLEGMPMMMTARKQSAWVFMRVGRKMIKTYTPIFMMISFRSIFFLHFTLLHHQIFMCVRPFLALWVAYCLSFIIDYEKMWKAMAFILRLHVGITYQYSLFYRFQFLNTFLYFTQ